MWRTISISDFGRVVTGKTPASSCPEHFGDVYPFITPTDMHYERQVVPERHVSEAGALQHRNQMLPPNSVCFVCIGATIGKVCMTRMRSLTNQQINSVVVDTSRHDPHFVYYQLSTYADTVKALAGGAATPIVSKSSFEQIEAVAPPLPTQRKIAAVLSAYDDLVENNTRRIKILEQMAQAIYREWFVNFRFPGHEKVRMVNSPMGKIPEGWEVVPFTSIADVLSGGTPKTTVDEYWNGEIPFFTPRDTSESFYVLDTDKHVTDLGISKCASERFPPDTVFITARGTVGKVAMPAVSMAMNQSCYALRGIGGYPQRYLFLLTLQQVDFLKKNTGGATFDTIVVDTFRRMQLVRPPEALVGAFSRAMDSTFDGVKNLIRSNAVLRRTRDLLLPKLISGEVDVGELEIAGWHEPADQRR